MQTNSEFYQMAYVSQPWIFISAKVHQTGLTLFLL